MFPIFMYHRVEPRPDPLNPCVISAATFAAHLSAVRDSNYSGWTIDQLLESQSKSQNPAANAAVITFDDGYMDNYIHAFPELERLGLSATFFIITGKIGTPGFMTWSELRDLHAHGMSIQSHSVSHEPLETLSPESIKRELQVSKATIEDGLGSPVNFISFPHGSYNQMVLKTAAESGYSAACSSDFGYFKSTSDLYRLPRISVRPAYGGSEFSKLLRADRRFAGKARLTAAVRRAASNLLGVERYQAVYNAYYGRNKELL